MLLATRTRRVRRVRERRVRTDDSVRSRFFQLEERRVEQEAELNTHVAALREQLSAINQSLQQIVQLLVQRQ